MLSQPAFCEQEHIEPVEHHASSGFHILEVDDEIKKHFTWIIHEITVATAESRIVIVF